MDFAAEISRGRRWSRSGRRVSRVRRHCEERSDEAIHLSACDGAMDCFASRAMTLQQIPAGRARRRPMFAERLDDVLSDLPLVYFVGPVDEPLRAHLGVPFGERRILAEAERAVKLDRSVDNLVHHMRMEDLGDRVLLP